MRNGRNIDVRAVHRGEPDIESLARRILELAQLDLDKPSLDQQPAE